MLQLHARGEGRDVLQLMTVTEVKVNCSAVNVERGKMSANLKHSLTSKCSSFMHVERGEMSTS